MLIIRHRYWEVEEITQSLCRGHMTPMHHRLTPVSFVPTGESHLDILNERIFLVGTIISNIFYCASACLRYLSVSPVPTGFICHMRMPPTRHQAAQRPLQAPQARACHPLLRCQQWITKVT